MVPFILPPNQPPGRLYRGGNQIAAFRNLPLPPPLSSTNSSASTSNDTDHWQPEDWIGSTTCCHGHDRFRYSSSSLSSSDALGLSRLPPAHGSLLVDAIEADPQYWLGSEHVAAFGSATRILVKLLDAGQRLPVHAHPSREWVARHLGSIRGVESSSSSSTSSTRRQPRLPCGKAELWFALKPGHVWLGLRDGLTRTQLRLLVETQDADALLGGMHQLHIEAGQAVFVPPGFLHAIGSGMFMVEVQEASDLSVLCEWQGGARGRGGRGYNVDGDRDGHLGLGFDVALTAVDRRPITRHHVEALVVRDQKLDGTLCEELTRDYFRVARHTLSVGSRLEVVEAGFAVLVVFEGALRLVGGVDENAASAAAAAAGAVAVAAVAAAGAGDMGGTFPSPFSVDLAKGSTVVVPFADGARWYLEGEGGVLIARPPRVLSDS